MSANWRACSPDGDFAPARLLTAARGHGIDAQGGAIGEAEVEASATGGLTDGGAGGGGMQRARGLARISFRRDGAGVSRLDDLYQEGAAKLRLPKSYDGGGPTAVFINSAGGLTGGDQITFEAEWRAGAEATVTSQAAERVYRRAQGVAEVVNRLTIAPEARAFWLPQETILFDRAGLRRRLDIDIAASAQLMAVEAVVLGRTAMGEEVRSVELADDWRIRRDGRLVYADALRLDGDARAILAGPATGAGARAFATVMLVAADAESQLGGIRALLAARLEGVAAEAAASAFDGLLSIRCLAQDGRALRAIVEPAIATLTGRALPRAWSI